MEIIGNVKTFEWGKFGLNSKVGRFAKSNDEQFVLNDRQTYAELWMGDHISGPSKVKSTGEPLDVFLSKNRAEFLGEGSEKLPFLFKVLSINKALSIQVHPNKVRIVRLFYSSNY